jgi:hypothetical protein
MEDSLNRRVDFNVLNCDKLGLSVLVVSKQRLSLILIDSETFSNDFRSVIVTLVKLSTAFVTLEINFGFWRILDVVYGAAASANSTIRQSLNHYPVGHSQIDDRVDPSHAI